MRDLGPVSEATEDRERERERESERRRRNQVQEMADKDSSWS